MFCNVPFHDTHAITLACVCHLRLGYVSKYDYIFVCNVFTIFHIYRFVTAILISFGWTHIVYIMIYVILSQLGCGCGYLATTCESVCPPGSCTPTWRAHT